MAARAEELLKEAEKLCSPARLPSFLTETPQKTQTGVLCLPIQVGGGASDSGSSRARDAETLGYLSPGKFCNAMLTFSRRSINVRVPAAHSATPLGSFAAWERRRSSV